MNKKQLREYVTKAVRNPGSWVGPEDAQVVFCDGVFTVGSNGDYVDVFVDDDVAAAITKAAAVMAAMLTETKDE